MLPDLKQITMSCLQYDPDLRPTADKLYQLLGQPEIYGLQRKIAVSRSTTVECQAIEVFLQIFETNLYIVLIYDRKFTSLTN